jgi:RNA polymerase sigma-70 factor (ECF subfamily)
MLARIVDELARIVDELARREGPRILAGLIGRLGGDFDLAEEAMQEGFARALEDWPSSGIPERPGAWITTVARRSAIDMLRRSRRQIPDSDAILERLAAPEPVTPDDGAVPDDRLRLLFTCCHPALAVPAQMALALRTLCGLSTREIARAFLEPEATTAQRLVRAKHKIVEARIPYVVPSAEELPERLGAVLATVYLMFNEGYSSIEHTDAAAPDFSTEAIRLARLVCVLMPSEAEAWGLLSLLLTQDSRRGARVGLDGTLIPLEEQERARWDQAKIDEGSAMLDHALAMRCAGPYQVQAAIAALHGKAASAGATDWKQIAALYGSLYRMVPTPVVGLNAAAAVAMVAGPEEGLAWIAALEARERLEDYYLLPAARADLLRRAGRNAEAAVDYRRAIELTLNAAERKYLERRVREVTEGA